MSSIDTNVSLSPFDWIAVAGYLGIVVGITVWSRFGQKDSSESYFLAGRGMNWIVVAIAIFATLFSTISFVASPGEAYGHGLMMLLPAFAMPIFVPLAVHLFLPSLPTSILKNASIFPHGLGVRCCSASSA